MGAAEFGEDVADKKVFNLVGNGALLAQDDARKGANHTQSALLFTRALLVVRGSFVAVDDVVDVVEDGEGLLPPGLGKGDEEVCGGNVGGRDLLVKVQLAVQVFRGISLEELNVVVRLAQDGEDEVLDEDGHVRLEVFPHGLGLHALVHKGKGVGQARLAEPGLLAHPLLNLVQVALEDFGGKVLDEGFGDLGVVVLVLGQAGGVSVSGPKQSACRFSCKACFPCTHLTNSLFKLT